MSVIREEMPGMSWNGATSLNSSSTNIPPEFMKVNCDGGWDKSSCRGSVGIVLQDSNGNIIAEKSEIVEKSNSSLLVEALALDVACKWMEELSINRDRLGFGFGSGSGSMEKRISRGTAESNIIRIDEHRPKTTPFSAAAFDSMINRLPFAKRKPPALLSLCLGVVGRHFEDIIPHLPDIATNFPADVKMALVAIARRRKLLTDDVLLALIDSSWEILDLCGSDVSDAGLTKVAEICKFLRAVDISRCCNATALGVSKLFQCCSQLVTLRCGGCMRSDNTIRGCLGILKPQLSPMEEDTWEEIDMEITHVAQSLRWLVWPTIDHDSLDSLSKECPRITVNPKPSSSFCKDICFPKQVLPDVALDEFVVEDVDPRTWLICGYVPKAEPCTTSDRNELSVAEKFRLAFAERDARLAPKRAKNARQRLRRSAKEWMKDTDAKAIILVSHLRKSLNI